MSAPNGTAARLIEVARSQVGIHEGHDATGYNNVVKYNTWYADLVKDKQFLQAAWCDIFVSWCARQAGISTQVIPNSAYTPATLNWYKARGRQVNTPQAGDIFYIYFASIGMVGHTGIVERTDGAYIYTLEGNTNNNGSSTGDGVYRLHRKIDSRMRFVRPAYSAVKPVTTPKPKVASRVATVSVEHLKTASQEDPPKPDRGLGAYADEVFTLEHALINAKWLDGKFNDGHYGVDTVAAVKGFQQKHYPDAAATGWLDKAGLQLLFKLADMDTLVTD